MKKKELVDKQGCDRDDDKDGVLDCLDQCPETPADVIVNSVGCPVDTIDDINLEQDEITTSQDSIQ